MSNISYKEHFKAFPNSKKLIAIGSLFLVISTLLPWYSDIDKYKVGDTFLGITGPLYLAGFIVLASALMSLTITAFEFLGKPLPKLPIEKKQIHIFTASVSILMILIVSSVYFHPKFGINITAKSSGLGVAIALFSVLTISGGLILDKNKKFNTSFRHHESLVNMGLETVKKEDLAQEKVAEPYSGKRVTIPAKEPNSVNERFSYFSGTINNQNK